MLAQSLHPNLLNVLCRTLANISSHPHFPNGSRNHLGLLISDLTRACSLIKDTNCLQSTLRCLRKFATHADIGEDYSLHRTLLMIAYTLKLNHKDVTASALDALEVCITSRNLLQSLWSHGHEPIELVNACVEDKFDETVAVKAVQLLCHCANDADGKAALSRAGSIEVLLNFLSSCKDKSSPTYKKIVEALCHCCKDVHGRQKIRDSGGLQLLINLLTEEEFESCYQDILSALICYYFDEHTLRYMIKKLGLLRSIVHHLTLMVANNKVCNPNESTSFFQSLDSTNVTNYNTPDSLALELAERGSDIYIDNDCDGYQSYDDSTSTFSPTDRESPPLLLASSSSPSRSQSNDDTSSTDNDIAGDSPDTLLLDGCSFQNEETPLASFCPNLNKTRGSINKDESCDTKFTLDIDTSTPMPANYIDSLLSSPNYYSYNSEHSQSFTTYSPQQTNSENRILLLLSRVSHLHDCQPLLAGQDVLPILVKYFLATGPSNIHCSKVLGRLFSNPHCFQDCLLTLSPSLIFHHMTHSAVSTATEMCQQLISKLVCVAESPYGQGVIAHMLLRGNSHEMVSGSLALILLERLVYNETILHYKQWSILFKMMISQFSLGGPTVCDVFKTIFFSRSYAVCHKMLVSYGGLQNLLLLVQDKPVTTPCACTKPKGESSKDTTAVLPDNGNLYSVCNSELLHSLSIGTLLFLAYYYFKVPVRKRRTSCNDSIKILSKLYKCEANDDTVVMTTNTESTSEYCLYKDFDHYPFDTLVALDDQGVFPVHRSLLMESSEVFAVMLSGRYQESASNQIYLHQISSLAFEVLVHHMYGCEFNSSECKFNSSPTDVNTVIDDDLVNNIIYSIDEREDPPARKLIKRTLLALVCADQFFLSSLKQKCEELLQRFINCSNVVLMFTFSQYHQCIQLSKKCVEFLISLDQGELQKRLFVQLLESHDSQTFLQIVESLFYVDEN